MKPTVLSELDTIKLAQRQSLARYGDGELRLAIGGGCSSQEANPQLAADLRDLLTNPMPGLVVGIPNFERTPNKETWDRYARKPYADLYRLPSYGSSFISRPDNAPWIDTPDYWDWVRRIWRGVDVTLVTGDHKGLTATEVGADAASVRLVTGPRQHAYKHIDAIEEEIGKPTGVVLLCLGATATVLAARLADSGVHAVDLGHVGMFMRHEGLYSIGPKEVASNGYRNQLIEKHATTKWGSSGGSHAGEVRTFALEIDAQSILDYGCGRGGLAAAMKERRVMEYDPGIPGKNRMPKPVDLVVCTDVLEHIEPDKVDNVLQHLFLLAGRGAYLVISTRLARELLPDGRNAHLTVMPPEWWIDKLKAVGWSSVKTDMRKGLVVWCRK